MARNRSVAGTLGVTRRRYGTTLMRSRFPVTLPETPLVPPLMYRSHFFVLYEIEAVHPVFSAMHLHHVRHKPVRRYVRNRVLRKSSFIIGLPACDVFSLSSGLVFFYPQQCLLNRVRIYSCQQLMTRKRLLSLPLLHTASRFLTRFGQLDSDLTLNTVFGGLIDGSHLARR